MCEGLKRCDQGGSCAPRAMLKIASSSSPSPQGRRDHLSPRERVGVRAIGLLKLLLVSAAIALASADNIPPRDSDYDYDPPVPGSYSLPVVKAAADGALLDSDGKSLNLHDLTHGRITVLSFIYTRCAAPKACPYATNVFGQLQLVSANDKALSKNMRLVSLSFDPEHDTPQHLAEYSENVRE